MCDPLTMALGSFAMNTVGAVGEYSETKAAATAQNKAYNENAVNARQSQIEQGVQMNLRLQQEAEAATDQKTEDARDIRAAMATASMAAGEANIAGNSARAVLTEFLGRQGTMNASINKQTAATRAQVGLNLRGLNAQATDRIRSIQRAPRPSFLPTALRIGSGGMDAYSDYKGAI